MAHPFAPTPGGGELEQSALYIANIQEPMAVEGTLIDPEAERQYLISLGVSPVLAAGIVLASQKAYRDSAIDVKSRVVE